MNIFKQKGLEANFLTVMGFGRVEVASCIIQVDFWTISSLFKKFTFESQSKNTKHEIITENHSAELFSSTKLFPMNATELF